MFIEFFGFESGIQFFTYEEHSSAEVEPDHQDTYP